MDTKNRVLWFATVALAILALLVATGCAGGAATPAPAAPEEEAAPAEPAEEAAAAPEAPPALDVVEWDYPPKFDNVTINLVGDRLRDVLNPRLSSHYGV